MQMKRFRCHPEILKEVMSLLYSKGIKPTDNIPVETWNLAYSCIHAQHGIETREWMNKHITIVDGDDVCPFHDMTIDVETGCPGCYFEYKAYDRMVDRDD